MTTVFLLPKMELDMPELDRLVYRYGYTQDYCSGKPIYIILAWPDIYSVHYCFGFSRLPRT